MKIGYLIYRLKVGLQNKSWLFNYKLQLLQMKLKFYWLMFFHCQVLNDTKKSAMIFAPHQDDESFGCGGVIALKRKQDVPVKVVFITDGGGSHSDNPRVTRQEIIQIRRQEALTALTILGVEAENIHFLNKWDGALYKMDTVEREETIAQIAQLIRTFQPQELYVTHNNDHSKDHEISYELVKAAVDVAEIEVDLWQYAIWLLWKPLLLGNLKILELTGAYRLGIHPVQSQKKQAIETYKSQYLPIDSDSSPVLPPGFLWRFLLPYEIFFKSN